MGHFKNIVKNSDEGLAGRRHGKLAVYYTARAYQAVSQLFHLRTPAPHHHNLEAVVLVQVDVEV